MRVKLTKTCISAAYGTQLPGVHDYPDDFAKHLIDIGNAEAVEALEEPKPAPKKPKNKQDKRPIETKTETKTETDTE